MTTAIHIELNALCLLILCVITYQSVSNVNQQMHRVLFRSVVYGVIAQLILDSLWLLVEGRRFPGAILANRVLNGLFLSMSVILGCIWYLYVLEALGHTLPYRLAASVGYVQHSAGMALEDFVNAADGELYKDKRAGR